jgi:hypothetical protein
MMNGNLMGQEVVDAICHSDAPPEVRKEVLALWQKICTAIVTHIQTNAVIPPGIDVKTADTINGATTGPGKVT